MGQDIRHSRVVQPCCFGARDKDRRQPLQFVSRQGELIGFGERRLHIRIAATRPDASQNDQGGNFRDGGGMRMADERFRIVRSLVPQTQGE